MTVTVWSCDEPAGAYCTVHGSLLVFGDVEFPVGGVPRPSLPEAAHSQCRTTPSVSAGVALWLTTHPDPLDSSRYHGRVVGDDGVCAGPELVLVRMDVARLSSLTPESGVVAQATWVTCGSAGGAKHRSSCSVVPWETEGALGVRVWHFQTFASVAPVDPVKQLPPSNVTRTSMLGVRVSLAVHGLNALITVDAAVA